MIDSQRPQADFGPGLTLSGEALKEFGRALEQVDEALRLHPSLQEALYNPALCCQQLMLWNEARQGWQSYLEKDSTTLWAEEARKNLDWAQNRGRRETITEVGSFQRFVYAYENRDADAAKLALRQARSANGNSIVEELIGAFLARSAEARNPLSNVALKMLAYAAQIEKASTGDVYLYDLWRYYRHTSPAQRQTIARARRELSQSYKLLTTFDIAKASSGYDKARKLFLAVSDGPEVLRAAFWAGLQLLLTVSLDIERSCNLSYIVSDHASVSGRSRFHMER